MRIALVDHRVSAGGVSRFLYALLEHLADAHPEDEFDLLSMSETITRDNLETAFASRPNVRVGTLSQPDDLMDVRDQESAVRARPGALRKLVDVIKRNRVVFDLAMRVHGWYQRGLRGGKKPWYLFSFNEAAINALNGYDVVFFAWPFCMEPARIGAATVGTFHDLHFKHFPDSYNPEMLRVFERQVPYWLREMDAAIVSTNFVATDIESHYPGVAESIDVIYLAAYGTARMSDAEAAAARKRHGVPEHYLIYSGARTRHKNLIVLLKALTELRALGVQLPLVITGFGTEVIGDPGANLPKGDAASEINEYLAASALKIGVDVLPLGYVSGRDVDALTQGASVAVSASLYEAGCGPAMDAWQWGVPVAFSSIPPFQEQLDVLGTKAGVFDPHSPRDVAEKIAAILADPSATASAVSESQEALARYSWDDVATRYYEVFLKAKERHARRA